MVTVKDFVVAAIGGSRERTSLDEQVHIHQQCLQACQFKRAHGPQKLQAAHHTSSDDRVPRHALQAATLPQHSQQQQDLEFWPTLSRTRSSRTGSQGSISGIEKSPSASPLSPSLRSASPEPEPGLTVASTAGADPNAWQHGYQRRSSSGAPWHQQPQGKPQLRSQQAQSSSRGGDSTCDGGGGGRSIARRMHSMAQVLPPVEIGPLHPTAALAPSSSRLAQDAR
jgi:hypothetical protein